MRYLLSSTFLILSLLSLLTHAADVYQGNDPSQPFFPTDPKECKDFRQEWFERIEKLRKAHRWCMDNEKKNNPKNLNVVQTFGSCPTHLQRGFSVPKCVPRYEKYCQASASRDEQVRECFESVADAVPDDSKELLRLYDEIGKKASTTNQLNRGGNAQTLSRRTFQNAMNQIAKVHKEALKDLAQANARTKVAKRKTVTTPVRPVRSAPRANTTSSDVTTILLKNRWGQGWELRYGKRYRTYREFYSDGTVKQKEEGAAYINNDYGTWWRTGGKGMRWIQITISSKSEKLTYINMCDFHVNTRRLSGDCRSTTIDINERLDYVFDQWEEHWRSYKGSPFDDVTVPVDR